VSYLTQARIHRGLSRYPSINLDQRNTRERPMTSFSPAHTVRIGFPATLEPRAVRATSDQAASSPRRAVLLGCLALVGVLALGIAARSLDVRPLAECRSGPVRLTLGSEAPATVTMGSGAACAISFFAPAASMNDVSVMAAPRHGTLTPRGRTGVIYRADAKYRGEDGFDLALRGRSDSGEGVAIVRVNVGVR
jgi:hypothetical protein